ncbi:PREDICTED: tyrosine-protein kinase receptor Tie-1-like [Priapulus caudatus]|uniref:Tyrosine-protein kinase receptor Tie-1-like n=1 Tax=Priapulus caudatus TaxID=37621 RepID=A0ABM1F686_PRICU|nr:PREDICTED: tyrosine-protein kinase receptor Tie-1-like [Priapulus caudatus]
MGRTGERIVAVKTCKDNTQHGRKVLMNETSVMKQLGAHPNVIGLIGAITVTEPITLITEYAGSGSLRNLLRKLHMEGDLMSTGGRMVIIYTGVDSLGRQEQIQATAVTLLGWAWQIANGMTYVTEKGFNHGDVTARNILVTDQGTVKLCDFSHSQSSQAGIMSDTHTIPVQSAAPEILQTGQRSEASDVWAFGVLLWEITTLGNELYSGIKEEDMLPYLLDGNRLKQSDYCSTQLYELMQSAWELVPSERPSFRQLQQELQTMISSAHKHIDLMVVHTPGAMLSENDCTTSSCRSKQETSTHQCSQNNSIYDRHMSLNES